ncbi:hypothetical protein [Citrobacter youngae]|nr:hypothetical protein [Citrobacter youngae]
MKIRNILIFVLLIMNFSAHASGLSSRGTTVVNEIASYYNKIVDSCENGDPAYECSGVLFHGTSSDTSQLSWQVTPDEANLGSVSFMYLRADNNFAFINNSYDKGYILSPEVNAPAGSYAINVECAFSLQANTYARDSNGCGQHSDYPVVSEPCQEQGITTPSEWYSHFTSVPEQERYSHQCGFRITNSTDFTTVLHSAATAGYEAFNSFNELMVPTWPANIIPPLKAIFYTVSSGLKYAQNDQQDYYNATKAFLPVIKMTLPTAQGYMATFSYSDSDQVVTDVASVLTAQYNDTRRFCNTASRPAYLCSGVTLRATDSSKSEPWTPDSKNISSGGTSFSYLRKDAKYSNLAYDRPNGYILYPQDDRLANQIQIDVLCAFPIDGATDIRDDGGCGTSTRATVNNEECQLQGIFTAEQWLNLYDSGGHNHDNQCGFIVSLNPAYNQGFDVADAFMQTIDAMTLLSGESLAEQNEMRLQTWGADKTTLAKLPLQAFFYLNGSSSGLTNAQKNQQTYYSEYNIAVPIVKITLPTSSAQDAQFSYSASDQKVPM